MRVDAYKCDGCGATAACEGDDASRPAGWAEVYLREEHGSRPERHYCPACHEVQAPPDVLRRLANAEEFTQNAQAGERSALDMAGRFERERDEAREAAAEDPKPTRLEFHASRHGQRLIEHVAAKRAAARERILHGLRDEVVRFACEMERNLRANDHKGHWRNCTLPYLFSRIDEETLELRRSVASPISPSAVLGEAADVANFAMMVADVVRARFARPKPAKETTP